MKRSEFVEFDGRKSNKCSRYRGIFCRSSVILISLIPNIVAVSLFNAFSAKNASFFLIMNIRVLGKKPQMLIYALRLRQDYKVHTYVISMEFSAVLLAKRHSGWERRRTAVFAGYTQTPAQLVNLKLPKNEPKQTVLKVSNSIRPNKHRNPSRPVSC